MTTEHRPPAVIEAEGLALEKTLAALGESRASAWRAFETATTKLAKARQRMADLKLEFQAAKAALSEKRPTISDTPQP